MTKVRCLKKLYEKLTGKKSDAKTVCEVLNKLGEDLTVKTDYRNGLIDTGNVWIDGKPIYKFAVKTTLGNLAAEINKHKPDTIINFYGQAVSTYGNQMPIPSAVAIAQAYKMDFLQDNTTFDVKLQYGEYFQDSFSAYAIIEFTMRDN